LDKIFSLNPQSASEANTTYTITTTLGMIVAIAATSTMSKAGLAMSDRWRRSSDGVDLDQPFSQTVGMAFKSSNISHFRFRQFRRYLHNQQVRHSVRPSGI
jgi:hypothetical protein